jgi:hypothetical protein
MLYRKAFEGSINEKSDSSQQSRLLGVGRRKKLKNRAAKDEGSETAELVLFENANLFFQMLFRPSARLAVT